MITRLDDGPDHDPDDPLTVILRPPGSDHLSPPPGRYEEIRRGAARRRLVRACAGAGVACAVATLVALPLGLTSADTPPSPVVPQAPPTKAPATSPSPSDSSGPPTPRPSGTPRETLPGVPSTVATTPSTEPSEVPTSPPADPGSAWR